MRLKKIFSLPKPYVFGKNEWKEKDLDRKEFIPKNSLNKRFLERLEHTPLSEKENEILNKNFGYKNIDKLKDDWENAAAEKSMINRLIISTTG